MPASWGGRLGDCLLEGFLCDSLAFPMNEVPTVPTPSFVRRRRFWYFLVFALVVGGILWVQVMRPELLAHQHRTVRARIEQHLQKAMQQVQSGPLLSSIHNQVANKLWYRKDVYPEKFAALADRLEAGQGPDLRTFEGCGQLILLLDATSPAFPREYLMAELHDAANAGQAAPPPPPGH